MTPSLRILVLGVTSVALVAVMGGGLLVDLRQRVKGAEVRLASAWPPAPCRCSSTPSWSATSPPPSRSSAG